MICDKCGRECADDVAFCPECGQKLSAEAPAAEVPATEAAAEASAVEATEGTEAPATEAPVAEAVEAVEAEEPAAEAPVTEEPVAEQAVGTEGDPMQKITEFVKKNLKWIALGVVALILVILLGSCAKGCGSDRYTKVEISKDYFVQAGTELLINAYGKQIEVDAKDYTSLRYSADASLTTVMVDNETLYVIKKQELVEVAEEIDNYWISTYGDTVVYILDNELYLYTVSNGKSVKIGEDASSGSVVLSPDGKTVAFAQYDDGEYTLFVAKNGKEAEELYSEARPIAVSNGAKYVYYIEDDAVYMNDEKITEGDNYTFYFNEDCTEMIYNDEEGAAQYFTAKKAESTKIKGDLFEGLVTPTNTMYIRKGTDYATAYLYGVDTFNKTLMWLGDALYYVYDKGEETEKVAGDIYSSKLSDDGKSFLYSDDDGELKYIKKIGKNMKEEEIASGMDVYSFRASGDLKDVYFTENGRLYYIDDGKRVQIAKEVSTYSYSDKHNAIFFITEDEELCSATKTEKSVEELADDVQDVAPMGDEMHFIDDDGTIFRLKSRKKFEKIYED